MMRLRQTLASLAALLLITPGLSPALAQGNAEAGKTIYNQHCASCHGKGLVGGNAQSMLDGVWQFGAGRGDLVRNIKFGIAANGMPDYKDTLSNRQINQVVGYILAAEKQAAPPKPPLPKKLLTRDYDVDVTVVAEGLEVPWALTFIDNDTALLTERAGRLRLLKDGELHPDAIADTPAVFAAGQGGLMDVAIDPDYADNGWVYLAYSHALPGEGNNRPAMTRVVRGQIKDHAWTDEQVVFEAPHDTYISSLYHYGSRLAFDPEGHLYITIGDRGKQDDAQDLTKPNGKTHRVNRDGTIPKDNPFADHDNALPSIYTLGNRNAQGLATHPKTGGLWSSEHGPMGGDEINLIKPGVNYGWPVITYGINYNGKPVSDLQAKEGLAQPMHYWTPSIAVCGIDFVQGDHFPRWQNNLFVTALSHQELRRMNIQDGRVIYQEVILKNAGRVRDIASAPDGTVYVVLNQPGTVLKLTNGGPVLRQ